ncbi:hypothetical protein FRB90_001936 [Tulasnella sp. 427]|nr:hypothetical protein FRB90_001936 [Tulasnella sp. 427]
MTTTPAVAPASYERPSAAERLASLKVLKNAIVGHPTAKKEVVDAGAIYWMFDWLVDMDYVGEDEALTWSVRLEAARVITTLANGSPYATLRLVRNRVLDAIMLSMTNLRPNRSRQLELTLCTALKAVVTSCSTIVGRLDNGLSEFYPSTEREEAKQALDRLFGSDTMDVYLPMFERTQTDNEPMVSFPLLSPANTQSVVAARSKPDWGKSTGVARGATLAAFETRYSKSTVMNSIFRFVGAIDQAWGFKAQEAALLALGSLVVDNPTVCEYLTTSRGDGSAILTTDSITTLDIVHQTKTLTNLLKILVESRPRRETSEWTDEVPRSAVRLREAAFIAVAAATLHTQENRREVLNAPVSYIDMVIEALGDEHVNVRYAACHAARAMSRSTEVQQTTAMDSGLAEKLWEALQKENDSRVEVVILMCLTNLVVENSPFREKMFQQGAIQYIVKMMDRPETSVQLNAIWTIRNTLWRASTAEHRRVFTLMEFDRFYALLTSADRQVRQQAVILARNTTTSFEMFDFVKEGLGIQRLFYALTEGLDIDEDELALQAACTLDNIACMVERRLLLDQEPLLVILKRRIRMKSGKARSAVFQLVKTIAEDDQCAKGLRERGFDVAVAEALKGADPSGMETDGGDWKIAAAQAMRMLNR